MCVYIYIYRNKYIVYVHTQIQLYTALSPGSTQGSTVSIFQGGLFFFAAGFGSFLGFLVLCFPAFLLLCFSASLLSCFLLFLLFAFPDSLLFMLLCFTWFFSFERRLLPALESRLSSCSCILWEMVIIKQDV